MGCDGAVDLQCDLGRVEQGVVNETVVDRALDSLFLFFGEFDRRVEFNDEIAEASGVFEFSGGDADASALAGQLELL